MKFLLIGNIPSILHGTYHTQTKPHNIPCQNFVTLGGQVETILSCKYLGDYLDALRMFYTFNFA